MTGLIKKEAKLEAINLIKNKDNKIMRTIDKLSWIEMARKCKTPESEESRKIKFHKTTIKENLTPSKTNLPRRTISNLTRFFTNSLQTLFTKIPKYVVCKQLS
jgi:hypothetical protein